MSAPDDSVYAWRLNELAHAGYSVPAAEVLAADVSVDLHQAKELVLLHGCPPDIAFDILSGEVAA
jgi:hypothetical protein